jgi:hypothetical protein
MIIPIKFIVSPGPGRQPHGAQLRQQWGVDPVDVDRIRALLVAGRADEAAAVVPAEGQG